MDIQKKINDKNFIKNLNKADADMLSKELRSYIIDTVLKNGGHLASNLGVVELTLAMHKVFDFEIDKVIFDVGHQCYVHKMLTGRFDDFSTLRKKDGISGFPKSEESPYDFFNTGHSGTSVSAALGMARARDLNCDKYNVIAFIGDGSIGTGMAFEALNDAGVSDCKIIIVLNDNEMSISENVGGMSSHLNSLRLNKNYLYAKSRMHKFLNKTGTIGNKFTSLIQKIKKPLKLAALKVPLFEELGITYIGLIDGHNFDSLVDAFEKAKQIEGPVIIHAVTKKGKGYDKAEINPSHYHGVSPVSKKSNNVDKSYTDIFGDYMVNKAAGNGKLVAITAAMCCGCGLNEFQKRYPQRFFDVGMSEEHAVTMAAGLAKSDIVPVFSVYSTFLQRSYDQILHDVCMQKLHVVFAIDRAGIVGEDGETHQGIFDFSYMLHMPNMTVLAPSCDKEFKAMLDFAIDKADGPVAIRYPKAAAKSRTYFSFDYGKPEIIKNDGYNIVIISVGRMLELADKCNDILHGMGYNSITLINLSTVKPLNSDMINSFIADSKLVVTIEDNIIQGGAGQYVAQNTDAAYRNKFLHIGFNDTFVKQGTQAELFEEYGITAVDIAQKIKKEMIYRHE